MLNLLDIENRHSSSFWQRGLENQSSISTKMLSKRKPDFLEDAALTFDLVNHLRSSSRLWCLDFLFVLSPGETPPTLFVVDTRTMTVCVC